MWAQDTPRFGLPADCEVGTTCTVQNYFDADPGPEAHDYTCGFLTYDRHSGIDFRVANLADMRRGVTVVAAAQGRVRGVRDGMDDTGLGGGAAAVRRRECGNGVLIDHGAGWESQYCHMMKDSVTVATGDTVEAGAVLGKIGMSGLAEFPHVHFEVRFGGVSVDPLIGAGVPENCGGPRTPLMTPVALEALAYRSAGLLNAGFSPSRPRSAEVLSGQHQAKFAAASSETLFFWIEIFGIRPGDRELFRVIAPGGAVLIEERLDGPDTHKAQWLRFVDKRRLSPAWPRGTYRGEYLLERREGGVWTTVLEFSRTVEVR